MAVSNSEYWAGSNGQSRYKSDNYRNSFHDWIANLFNPKGDAGVKQREKQIQAMQNWDNGNGWQSKRGHDNDSYTYDDYLDFKMYNDALNGRMTKDNYNVEDENDNLTILGDWFDFTDNIASDIATGQGKDAQAASNAFDVDTMVFDEDGNLDIDKLDRIMATIGDRKFQNYGDQSWDSLTDEDLELIRSGAFDDENNLINAVEGQRHSKDADLLNSIGGGNGKGYDILGADYDEADRAYAVKNLIEFLPWGVAGGALKGGQVVGRGIKGLKDLKGLKNLERANQLEKQAANIRNTSAIDKSMLLAGKPSKAEAKALEMANKIEKKAAKLRGRGSSKAVMDARKKQADELYEYLINPESKYNFETMSRTQAYSPVANMEEIESLLPQAERRYSDVLRRAADARAERFMNELSPKNKGWSPSQEGRGLKDFVERELGRSNAANEATAAAGETAQAAAAQANRFAGRNLDELFEGTGKNIKFKDNDLWKTLNKEEQDAFKAARNEAAANNQAFDPVKWIKENLDDFKAAGSAAPAEATAAAEAATAAEAAAPAAEAAAEATKGGPLRWLAKHPKALIGAGAVGVGYPVVSGYLSGKEESESAIAGNGSGKTSISDLKEQAGEDGYVWSDDSGRIWFITASGRRAPLTDPYGNPVTEDNYYDYFTD